MKKLKVLLIISIVAVCLSLALHAGATDELTKQINVLYRNIRIFIDGDEMMLTDANGRLVEPFIVGGTTFVPLRAIGELFGKNVIWDNGNSTVHIDSPHIQWEKPDYQNAPPVPTKNVTVSTPQELADAIAPNTCITLNAGVYDMSTVTSTDNRYVVIMERTAEFIFSTSPDMIVQSTEGLTLQAAPGAKVEIVTPNRFSEVLMFDLCNGVKLSGIEAGHSVTGEYECDASVIVFNQSANIVIEDCLFYGSGSIGITLRNCVSAWISNTTVTDCSLYAVDIWGSKDITYSNCKFIDNRAYSCAIWGYNSSASFFDCAISGNKNLEWGVVECDDDVLFEHCVFKDNGLPTSPEPVFKGKGIRLRNCEIEKAGFSDYWEDSAVIDLGGNKLS